MAKGKLTVEQQRAVVQWFARCHTPSQVAAMVSEHFGVRITRQSAQGYDPASVAGSGLSEDLRALFAETRGRFFREVDAIPITHQAVRLRRLEDLYQRHSDRGNLIGAAEVLEQAAREVGGLYTNRRQLTGRDGGPIAVEIDVEERRRATVSRMLERLLVDGLNLDDATAALVALGVDEADLRAVGLGGRSET